MHLSRIDIYAIPPLDGIGFDFDRQVNLFIGTNASGKSTVLRAIERLHSFAIGEAYRPESRWGEDAGRLTNTLPGDESDADIYLNYDDISEDPVLRMKASDDWPRDASGVVWNAVPHLYVPAVRINLHGMNILGEAIEYAEDEERDAKASLRDRFRSERTPKAFLRPVIDTSGGVFDGRWLQRAIESLDGVSRFLGIRPQFWKALQVGHACAQRICAEVIQPYPPVHFREMPDVTLEIYHYMGVTTSDPASEPVYAGALSSGSQGTLLWIWALALKIADHYGWADGWENRPAILLIDEIENHLHPTWQRRVIPALLEHFPGLQIFATTHSPFVVAGLRAGQVHLLKRDENGVVTADTRQEEIVGWTADEILRNMMGVEDPTDDETATAARELRELRNEGPLDDPDAEAERQERMLKLRQRVDRDLLEGGPWAAQRAQFEEQFADALEKYRQSKDLGQENG